MTVPSTGPYVTLTPDELVCSSGGGIGGSVVRGVSQTLASSATEGATVTGRVAAPSGTKVKTVWDRLFGRPKSAQAPASTLLGAAGGAPIPVDVTSGRVAAHLSPRPGKPILSAVVQQAQQSAQMEADAREEARAWGKNLMGAQTVEGFLQEFKKTDPIDQEDAAKIYRELVSKHLTPEEKSKINQRLIDLLVQENRGPREIAGTLQSLTRDAWFSLPSAPGLRAPDSGLILTEAAFVQKYTDEMELKGIRRELDRLDRGVNEEDVGRLSELESQIGRLKNTQDREQLGIRIRSITKRATATYILLQDDKFFRAAEETLSEGRVAMEAMQADPDVSVEDRIRAIQEQYETDLETLRSLREKSKPYPEDMVKVLGNSRDKNLRRTYQAVLDYKSRWVTKIDSTILDFERVYQGEIAALEEVSKKLLDDMEPKKPVGWFSWVFGCKRATALKDQTD